MIKSYHLLTAFLIGALLCGLAMSYWPSPETDVEDPIIHQLREVIAWRAFKESKLKDSLKFERQEKMTLAKENIDLKARADKAYSRYLYAKKAIPLTRKDTIVFLQIDTAACDSALTRARELAAGLTIEIMTDEAIIKGLDSINSNLNVDKKDLVKVDSLSQIDKKQLRKEARRKARRAFFKGAGIGGAVVAILVAIF